MTFTTDHSALERRLRRLEARHRGLAEAFPHGALFWFDEQLRYTYCAGTALAAHGLRGEDFVGHFVEEMWPSDVAEVITTNCRLVFDGISRTYVVSFGGRWYRTDTVPVCDEDGVIREGVAIARDISEERERIRRLEFQSAVLDQIDERVLVVGEGALVVYANAAEARAVGRPIQELVGLSIDSYPGDEGRAVQPLSVQRG